MDWQTLRNQFMRQIGGDPPGAQLEEDLIVAYTEHPDVVERAIEKIALAHKAGKIRSPWGALKAEIAKASQAANNPSHDTGASRHKAISRAEQWIRAAGAHMPWIEVQAELFNPPEQTPPAEWLIQLERETRDDPGRPIYDQLLKAAIVRTMNVGQEPVPDTAGRLAEHDSPALRDRLRALHAEHRPAGEQLEQDAIDRGLRYQADRKRLDALRKPLPKPDDRPLEIKDGIRIP